MGLTPAFTQGDIRNFLNQSAARVHQVNIARLKRVGLQFVIDARTKADFTDQTGNLRSSIGFIIVFQGEIVESDFEGQTQEGQTKAEQFAFEVAMQHSRGYALIVVAGMEYAAAVEAKGKDVLTGSSAQAKASLNKYFKRA